MALLTKAQILDADDLEREEVYVPQWGGSVLVQGLTAKQRGQWQSLIVDQKAGGRTLRLQDIQIRLCGMAIIDEQGRRVFADSELHQLASKSAGALQLVFDVAARLSGLSDEEVEELAGNSDETLSDDSLSD